MATQPHDCFESPNSGSVSRNARFVTAVAIAPRSIFAGAAATKRTTLVLAERNPTGACLVARAHAERNFQQSTIRSAAVQGALPRAPLRRIVGLRGRRVVVARGEIAVRQRHA